MQDNKPTELSEKDNMSVESQTKIERDKILKELAEEAEIERADEEAREDRELAYFGLSR